VLVLKKVLLDPGAVAPTCNPNLLRRWEDHQQRLTLGRNK
jgi:hypothetical protein